MIMSGWWILLLAIPVLLLGEVIVGRVPGLSRFYLPAPIVGGLLIAIVVLVVNVTHPGAMTIDPNTAARWWTWLVTPEVEWLRTPAPSVPVYTPFMVAFFTCVGLNASWVVAKVGSWQLMILLIVATVLAVVQNVAGIAVARAMHVSPYVGLLCGSVTLTGGPGTAMGFVSSFEQAGFAQARAVGLAAAMFGIVTASLLGGPVGAVLIRVFGLKAKSVDELPLAPGSAGGSRESREVAEPPAEPGANGGGNTASRKSPFLSQLRAMSARPGRAAGHLALLLVCVKVGAWVSFGLRSAGMKFPVYIGAMLVGIVVRNIADLGRTPRISTQSIGLIASILLGIYLTVAVMMLDLLQLRSLAGPMLVILFMQVAIMLLFAAAITFPALSMDYEAAVASAGHVGFGLGITPNAVANMESLIEAFGAAPRAMLVVTLVGGFLIDVTNSATIVFFLNRLK